MKNLNAGSYERWMRLMTGAKEVTLATIRPDGYPQATTVNFVSDDLIVYAVVGLESRKAHSIQSNNRVSLTFHLPYTSGQSITGISMGGRASIVDGGESLRRVMRLLQDKFPDYVDAMGHDPEIPWQGMQFIAIEPEFLSILDYGKGFGSTDLFAIDSIELHAWA